MNQRSEECDYVVRQAKEGFVACLNRDAHRSNRLPTMAVLNTFLGWDIIQGRTLHLRLYPILQPVVGLANFCGSSAMPPWLWASCTSMTSFMGTWSGTT